MKTTATDKIRTLATHRHSPLARILPTLFMAMTLFCACGEEDQPRQNITFNATIERLDDNGSKVALTNERWTYWEIGDKIDLTADNTGSKFYDADLVNSSAGTDFEEYNGVFVAAIDYGAKYFLGLFPQNISNSVSTTTGSDVFKNIIINLTAIQPLRNDSTFGRNVFPMVAWYGKNEAPDTSQANLDFHSLGCLVRLQLFCTDGGTHVIDHIDITSDLQLCGRFKVVDYNTADPYLVGQDGSQDTRSITLNCTNNPELATMTSNSLHTFYIVVPATASRNVPVERHFTINVVDTEGNHCQRSFSATVRRNGITYLQALHITSWAAPENTSENGSATAGIVGNGTATRPFKIYTVQDLNYVSSCFNTVNATDPVNINNIEVTPNSHFCIMRSDIALDNSNWATPIKNFKGIMTYTANGTASEPGIRTTSNTPLFESISEGGTVDGITIRVVTSYEAVVYSIWTPFCTNNHGTIKDCTVETADGVTLGASQPFAGLCVYNYGTMQGCGCSARLRTNGSNSEAAGICYQNYNLIKGCYVTSPTEFNTSQAAGICYNNTSSGSIEDCYFALRITSSDIPWGGIAYTNNGTIHHCTVTETSTIVSSGKVGGIACMQNGGVINLCNCNATLQGSTVGGIAAEATGGRIINSAFNNSLCVVTAKQSGDQLGGGLVGKLGGTAHIANSYAYLSHVARLSASGTIGGLVGTIVGTADTIRNCYAYETAGSATGRLYGTATTTDGLQYCYIVDGTQTGATSVNHANMTTLLTDLTNNRSTIAADYTGDNTLLEWSVVDGVPTINNPYVQ